MLQALSFRPKMERQPACKLSVIIFRKGRSDEMRDLNICCWSIVSRQNRRKRIFAGDGGAPMSVSGLNCVESCLNCHLRSRSFFCDLSQESIVAFHKIKHAAVFPVLAVVLVEGQSPCGVFIRCQGRAKLSATSREARP